MTDSVERIEQVLAARKRLCAWVDRDVSDWHDPVLDPQTVDDLRLVLGMPPEDREDDISDEELDRRWATTMAGEGRSERSDRAEPGRAAAD